MHARRRGEDNGRFEKAWVSGRALTSAVQYRGFLSEFEQRTWL